MKVKSILILMVLALLCAPQALAQYDSGNTCWQCPICGYTVSITPYQLATANPYNLCPVCYSAYAFSFVQIPCQAATGYSQTGYSRPVDTGSSSSSSPSTVPSVDSRPAKKNGQSTRSDTGSMATGENLSLNPITGKTKKVGLEKASRSPLTTKPITDIRIPQNEISRGWNRTFGGSDYDQAQSVQQTSDGGYILAGETESYGAGDQDAWLIKTDSNGGELWNRTFGGSHEDTARSVQPTSDRGYILVGGTESYGDGSYSAWLIKTDSDGNELWNKTFGGSDWGDAYSVQQTSDGGYILAGETDSYGAGDWDAWLIKTDSNGVELWNRTFGEFREDTARSIQHTSDGGYILAGRTDLNTYGETNFEAWLIKVDSNGNKIWDNTFDGGASGDTIGSVQLTSDGGYILAGATDPYEIGDWDIWLIKTDSKGNKFWEKTFDGSIDDDEGNSIRTTSDGGYVVAGFTSQNSSGNVDAWLIKTDSDGNELWNKTFGGSYWDDAESVQLTSDGGYILAGETESYGDGSSDAWLIKTDSDGNE